ncbi:neck protein [Vibrio phage 1.115.B._10N.222.49.B11]|nr:neck protein [Vibrio phage 1.115.A._10N.222.49.B11]AUR88559.1 neck protein [Vibrio phage 1.115.B._10N.222.49.B11]
MSFGDDLKKESANVTKALEDTVMVAAISFFSGVITRSPVGNTSLWKTQYPPQGYVGGRFRSNWFLTFDTPSNKTTSNTNEASQRLSDVAGIEQRDYSDTYILTNNLDYSEAIESGHSTQAPAGVVAPEYSKIQQQLPKIEATVNKKYGVD